MARPPALGLVIMMLLGISGCAGAPQRFSWSSAPGTSGDRADSPATDRYSWWHRAGSKPVDAGDPRQDLAQSSPSRSQPKETRSRHDIWPEWRSDRLARLFPSLSRRGNAAETSRSMASERSDSMPNSTGDLGLHASRPVTRFRDVPPEPEEGQDNSAVGLSAVAAANAPSSNEGEVLRASLPPRERSASTFTQGIVEPQSPVFQSSSGESKGSALVANSEPVPAPALIAMNLSGEPENLLPQSLMRDQEEPADSPLALAPIQDQAPSAKPSSDKTQEKQSSSASPPAEKPKSKSTTPPQPAPRRKPATPAQSRQEPSAEPKKSTAATKPAADEMKLQSPELEPAPAIQPPSRGREPRPEAPKGVISPPSPPPAPSAVREPAAPAPAGAAMPPAAVSAPPVSPPAAAAAPPAAVVASPAASVASPAASGSAPAGYVLSPPAQPGPAEVLTWPGLDGKIKSLPSAQLPTPVFPSSYGWSAPTASSQVMPAPQTACVACTTQTKKCGWTSGKCKLLLMRKLKCLKDFIHEHCPFKKKASNTCCQNCPCCGPLYIGAMPSAQWIQGSPLFAPVSFPVSPSPPTPQASQSAAPVRQRAEDASPASLSPLDSSAGTKPGDVSQGGEDLKPIVPEGLDKTP